MTNEEKTIALFRILGEKFYGLQIGMAAMFLLCQERKVFTMEEFTALKDQVSKSPDMAKLRALLDSLSDPKTELDIDQLLREFQGTVQ
ncbi:MAG TPA: hypothetical protein VN519_03685 [Bryobacteraceae bacterium]|nr:hypothetical protein [Bryobacteraceae bacterium]